MTNYKVALALVKENRVLTPLSGSQYSQKGKKKEKLHVD
jgi:hypothetical protein